jgi:lipoprotein-releasing system ATP-binding protein
MHNKKIIKSPLEVKEVYKSFVQGGQTLEVLKGANYKLEPGIVTGLVGPSGSGKSTLLQIIGLLDKPDTGEVIIKGTNARNANDKILTKIRAKRIGFIYQFHHLLPEFTALENVIMQMMINNVDITIATEKAKHVLELLKLTHRINHLPSELSGGEQQRVAIARALVKSPALILADEPTGNLDPYNAELVFDLFVSVVKELNLSALIATHNDQLVLKMDSIITLKNGKITHF